MVTVTSLRWMLLVLSILGVLFVVTGIVMAALHAVGEDFLIFALVFIGLGVVLVAVVVVAWKCTPPGSEPIHAILNIGDSRNNRRDRRHRDRRPHRQRNSEWHGGMMYPEFQYRRPPPSYAASMQAYQAQAQIAAEAQSNNNVPTQANNNSDTYSLPGSPPPSYRSRASTIHSGVHITFPPGHDSAPNSRPPTYRSRADSHARPRLPMDSIEPSSPSTAPADVSFNGPVMNAETVQQIIGTCRNHHLQQSAGASIWHTRSSSLDLTNATGVPGHRRGASLDRNNISALFSSSSQENQTPSKHSEIAIAATGAQSKQPATLSTETSDQAAENTERLAQAKPELSYTEVKENQAAAIANAGNEANNWNLDFEDEITHTLSIAAVDSNPEHYDTPL